MKSSKTFLILAVVILIAAAYFVSTRYEMQTVTLQYQTQLFEGSGPLTNKGVAIVFRLDRWTGEIRFTDSMLPIWQTVKSPDNPPYGLRREAADFDGTSGK